MNKLVSQAISERKLMKFEYDGEARVVEPHCHGRSAKGNDLLRAFQTDGGNSTGELGWKLFDIAKATSVEILDERFKKARDDYKKGDKAMVVIYQEI